MMMSPKGTEQLPIVKTYAILTTNGAILGVKIELEFGFTLMFSNYYF